MQHSGDDGFGAALRSLRNDRSLTQEELAERAGLSVKAVSALERGERKRPYPHTVRALADALGLDDAQRTALSATVPRPGRADRRTGLSYDGRSRSVTAPATALVGREDDIVRVVDLVGSGARLVTLTGPGGVGKTRVAVAAMERLAASYDLAVGVDLAAVRDPGDVLPLLAAAVDLPERGAGDVTARLVAALAGRRALVLLDNFEQLLDGALDVADLVARCPGLVALVTSRAALRVRSEHELGLAPLALPEAVRLFRDRAGAAGARLDPGADDDVEAICRRLDGLPLALELAASGARLLPPAALLARLEHHAPTEGPRDLAARQRTMAAALDWSLDLVDPGDAALFARLAAFSGSFTLDAAAAVTAADDLLGPLGALVDHSLVARVEPLTDPPRFRLLEPVRQYAGQRLLSSGAAAAADAADRHAGWFHARALAADVALRGPDLRVELDRLDADHANLRSSYLRLLEQDKGDHAAELAGSVWLYLALRGHAREGLGWLDRAEGAGSDAVRARRLIGRMGLMFATGDIAGMRTAATAAVPVARRVDDVSIVAEAATLAGHAAVFVGAVDEARTLLEEALAAAAGSDLPWVEAHTLVALGQLALVRGDLDDADGVLGRALGIARDLGNDFTLATCLTRSATVTALRGDSAGTAALLGESISRALDVRMSWPLSYSLPAMAGVAVRLGEGRAAAVLLAASASLSVADAVDPRFPVSRELAAQDLAATRDQLGEEAFAAAWQEGRVASPAELAELVDDVTRLARG